MLATWERWVRRFVLQLRPEVLEGCLGRLQRKLRVQHLLLNLRVTEFQDDRLGLDRGARAEEDPFDPAVRGCGQPSRVFL